MSKQTAAGNDVRNFKGRHLLRLADFSRQEILEVLQLARRLKEKQKQGIDHRCLNGKTLAMIFEKPSSRTRISFEVGMFQLGGNAINVNAGEIKMGQRESIADVARTLSRYVDAVLIRAYYHWTIEEFARNSSVPVINGLSDHSHPCQALADILTIEEKKGRLDRLKICYIGDGNNVCNSLIEICSVLGIDLSIACPSGYEPRMREKREKVAITNRPADAAKDADVVYTDVWVSMGQEEETLRRLREFSGFTVNQELLSRAKPDVIFMHCLPAHRGYEVDAQTLEGPHSVVFDQAENRLHAQKAVLALLAGDAL